MNEETSPGTCSPTNPSSISQTLRFNRKPSNPRSAVTICAASGGPLPCCESPVPPVMGGHALRAVGPGRREPVCLGQSGHRESVSSLSLTVYGRQVCLLRVGGGQKKRELYYKKLAHTSIEAGESHNLPSKSWRPRKADNVSRHKTSGPKTQEELMFVSV